MLKAGNLAITLKGDKHSRASTQSKAVYKPHLTAKADNLNW